MEIRVDCYDGYQGQERPLRLVFGRRQVLVEDVLDSWIDPDHRYFKLRGEDGCRYIVRYDARLDRWELTLFDGRREAQE